MADVKIPGIGNVDSKWVWAGGALVLGIAGYAWWRQGAAAAAEAAEESADYTTDAAGEEVYPYGTAYATDYAYDSAFPSYVPPSFGVNTTVQSTRPTTNSEWTQAAVEWLESVGTEANLASAAVARYLLRECLSSTQADIVRQAVAGLGPPPTGTFSIITCPAGPAAPPGGSPAAPPGATLPGPGGLRKIGASRTTLAMTWNTVAGAAGYRVYRAGVGTNVGASTDNHVTIGGLRPNTTYKIHVRAVGADGVYSQKSSAVVSMKTAK
jgi:hypothetical protein